MIVITVLPFIGLVFAVAMLWNRAVGWTDLALFLGLYVLCGFGITIGYHRMLDPPRVRGGTAAEGGCCSSSGRSRSRARRSTGPSTTAPTTPSPTRRATRTALTTASTTRSGASSRDSATPTSAGCSSTTAPTASGTPRICSADKMVMFVDRSFWLWVIVSFALPFALGGLITAQLGGRRHRPDLGRLVRLFFNHHITWSVNSICHFFGRRPFTTSDQSTNNWVLALPSLGESWHHNHHVFPTSAVHGLSPWKQFDLSGPLDRAVGEDGAGAQRAPTHGRADRAQARAATAAGTQRLTARGVSGRILLGRQPRAVAAVRGRELPDDLHRPAVQHRAAAAAGDARDDSRQRGRPRGLRRAPLSHPG